jgi:hypothetical protein
MLQDLLKMFHMAMVINTLQETDEEMEVCSRQQKLYLSWRLPTSATK